MTKDKTNNGREWEEKEEDMFPRVEKSSAKAKKKKKKKKNPGQKININQSRTSRVY